MINYFYLLIIPFIARITPVLAEQPMNMEESTPEYSATIDPISAEMAVAMTPSTWRPGCPVSLTQLRSITLMHWGYDDKPHEGVLIVHKKVAEEVVDIFEKLYEARFPIERMQPIHLYQGDDEASMKDNNSSAFNCRAITGQKRFSKHSYGIAIDINPQTNPYVQGPLVLPVNAQAYTNRDKNYKGKIDHNSLPYHLFRAKGWFWGGDWQHLKDYHHFEKNNT